MATLHTLKRAAPAVPASDTADAAQVLGKATARAAQLLGLSGAALARTLGTSEATISRLMRGERGLDPQSKEGELALLLVRLYRSLDALVGNEDERRIDWMRSHNSALNGTPRELILSAQGLVMTLAYVDAMRAPI